MESVYTFTLLYGFHLFIVRCPLFRKAKSKMLPEIDMAIEDEQLDSGASHDDEANAETNAAEPLARLMRTHLKKVGVGAVTIHNFCFYQ